MNFVIYNPETSAITCVGYMDEIHIEDKINEGDFIILVTEWPADFEPRLYDVDLETKTLVRNSTPLIPPPPPPTIYPISDRQFFQQAAIDGYISQAEALAAVQTGLIPGSLQAIVDQISDPDERFNAQMILSGATTFTRGHPLTNQIGTAMGKTPAELDAFFIAALSL